MPKLPTLTAKKLISFLEKAGFILDHTSGSHIILYHPADKKRAVVPFHRKDMATGTLLAILKQAGYTKEDFVKKYQK